jgi:tetratricopeptide (TPR) repeat protein
MMAGKQVRKIDLLHALNEYDVVHYAGHAEFNEADPSRSGWILQDAVLTAAELRRVQHPPLLVFSNACQAGVTTRWQSATHYDGQTFGIGSAFLLAGTQNYIGTFCPVNDGHSATFAADFYQHLTQGASIGNALAAARQHAYLEADVSGLLWASYMHYGNPTFCLPLAPQASVEMGSTEPAVAAEPADGAAVPLVSEPHYQPLEAGSRSVATTITPNTDFEPWVEDEKPNSAPDNPTTMLPLAPTTPSRGFWTLWLARGGVSMLALVVIGMALFYAGALSRSATRLPEQAYQALERGEWRQAESMFQQLRDDPTPALQSQGYAGLAAVAYARGEQEDALRLLQAAQGLDGENGYGHFLCAQAAVALSRGTLQKASDFLKRLQPNAFTLPYCQQLHGRMQIY